jgi:hypothetical protein
MFLQNMFRSPVMQSLTRSWKVPSIRRFPTHHFAPPTFLPRLPQPCGKLPPAQTRCQSNQARGAHENAGSEESTERRLYYPSTDSRCSSCPGGGSEAAAAWFALGCLWYMIFNRRNRRERERLEQKRQFELLADVDRILWGGEIFEEKDE